MNKQAKSRTKQELICEIMRILENAREEATPNEVFSVCLKALGEIENICHEEIQPVTFDSILEQAVKISNKAFRDMTVWPELRMNSNTERIINNEMKKMKLQINYTRIGANVTTLLGMVVGIDESLPDGYVRSHLPIVLQW